RRSGWRLEIAIPYRLPWLDDGGVVEPDHRDDPPIHRLEPIGRHIRFWWFRGLSQLLDQKHPRIVYLENSPESVMAWVTGSWCIHNGAMLIANTNENDILPISAILHERSARAALKSIRSHVWGRMARGRVNHVVAICKDGRDAMQSIGFANAVSIMPLG